MVPRIRNDHLQQCNTKLTVVGAFMREKEIGNLLLGPGAWQAERVGGVVEGFVGEGLLNQDRRDTARGLAGDRPLDLGSLTAGKTRSG